MIKTLVTERLILRPWDISDVRDMFYGWANDEEVTKYLTWNAHDDIEITKMVVASWVEQYQKPERINFAIELKETGKLIGGIDVVGYIDGVPVIGYVLSRQYWNKGYMSEAAKCVIEFLFSLGHSKILIDADKRNIGSNKVIQKCGGIFIKEEIEERPLKNDKVIVNRYCISK